MICIQIDNKFDWLGLPHGLVYPIFVAADKWLNWVGQNRETDEEHDEHCVEEGFQLARVKFDRDGVGGREALGLGNRSINIWDGSELGLAWYKKSSSYFKNNFLIFSLSGMRDVLHWVNFLVLKTFSNIFRSTFCWGRRYLNIFYIPFIFYYCQQVLITLRVSLLLSLLKDTSVAIGDDEDSFQFSPEVEFTSHLHVHVTFATETEVKLPYNYYSVKNMLKLLAFKWLLNELLLQIMIRAHLNLVICVN